MRKRLLSALLAMAMVLTMLPVSAFAVEGQVDMTDVVAANLHDTRLDITDTNSPYYGKGIADDKLYQAESYKVTAQAANSEENVVNVTVEIKDLKEHANASSNDPILAGWVGVGVPYIEGAQYASGWKPGVGEGALTPEAVEGFSQEVDGKKYVTRYFNASNETKKEGQILVKVGGTTTTYNINLAGAKVATPSIKIGFNAAGDNANTEATAWNKEMRSDKALAITDSERNTIYAAIDGLNTRKAYTVELQYSETANGAFTKIDDFHAFGNAQTPEHKVVNTVLRKTFTPWDDSQGADMQAELKAGFYKMVLKQNSTEIASDPIELVEITVDPTENGELAVVEGSDDKVPFEAIADGADKGKIKLFAVKGAEKAAFEDIITATAKTGFELDTEIPWVANAEKTVFTANIEAPVPVLVVAAATEPLTDLGNKAIADLQGALSIAPADKDNVIKVTGTSKYVSGWTQFSSNEDEQKGNYVALKLTSDPAGKVSIKKNNTWVALDDNIVVVLLDGPSQNKIEVALGDITADTKAAYTIDLTGMTKQAETKPVDKVTVLGIGFEATGVAANAGIANLGGYVTDCEDNTMFVRFAGLTASKHYKVEFTNSKGELVYSSLVQDGGATKNHEITGTTTSTVYFAFGGDGSPSLKPIASGVYTAKLYEKTEDAENPWKEVNAEGTASVELHKLTVKNGATTMSEIYYQSTKTVDAPAALENTTTAAFKGWKKGSEIVTSVAMTADVTLEAVFENYVIDADTLAATADGAALKAEITTAADGKKTIAISGMAPEGTTEITLKYKLNKDGAVEETETIVVAVNSAKDAFTATTTEVVATEVEKYAVSVAGITVSAKVAAPAPVVTVGEDIKPEDKTTVETAAKSTTITEISDLVAENNEAVNQTVQSVSNTEKETAVTALNALDGVTGVTTENVELVVQPVMDVKPTAYDATTAKTFTLEVTAAYRVVAVKEGTAVEDIKVNDAGVADANAVVVKKPVPMEVETSVTIVVNLPAAIGAKADGNANTPIPVLHEKSETDKHYHTATVVRTGTDPDYVYTATVISSDGLSPFTFDASANLVAEVNGKSYTSLADAIAAVENNGTIKLLANITEKVEVARAIVFTVDANEKTGADKIVAADGYTLKVEGTKYTFTKNSNPGSPIGGGGGGATTYSVNVPTTEHGTVTVNPRNASKDATVTVTVSPNQGYILDTLTVTDKDGNNIELTKVDSNKYTFKMPASRVEIKASFKEGTAPADGGFTDITSGEYYYDAVLWAVDKGITTGLTDTTFGPNASCTRAQMVTFLWRAAGSPEPTTTTTAFTDVDSNEYYYKAMLWAVEKGITKGTTDTTFAPNATVTRAQTVTFLYRYAGSPAVNGTNAFTDLEAGEYYVDAVQWAATNGITTGTTETTFSPANNCTRGQIVTFLYRHIVK